MSKWSANVGEAQRRDLQALLAETRLPHGTTRHQPPHPQVKGRDKKCEIHLPKSFESESDTITKDAIHELHRVEGRPLKTFGNNLSEDQLRSICHLAKLKTTKARERVESRHKSYFKVTEEGAKNRGINSDSIATINAPLPRRSKPSARPVEAKKDSATSRLEKADETLSSDAPEEKHSRSHHHHVRHHRE